MLRFKKEKISSQPKTISNYTIEESNDYWVIKKGGKYFVQIRKELYSLDKLKEFYGIK